MSKLDWVRTFLAIGPRPNATSDWQALEKSGISLIIDLNDSSSEGQRAKELGIQYLGLKIDDPPTSPESLRHFFQRICDRIDEERKSGGKVYLHCTAGQQRSPTCAMAYLMSDGETRQNAKKLVQAARLGVWAGPVSTATWERALELWERELSKAKY